MNFPNPDSIHSNAAITAIGSYVPERVMTNADLEKLVDTNDEWIVPRTGIRERRIAAEHEYTSDLCIAAVQDMIERYGVNVEDVDYIIVATTTPDAVVPGVASLVQARFGIARCGAVDVQAACAGFASSIQLANGLILSGMCRKVLVIGGETLSKVTDYTDRTTCILFGDGAGAFLMEKVAEGGQGITAMHSSTDGSLGHHVYLSGLSPLIGGQPIQQHARLVQNGREVYKWAVTQVSEGITGMLTRYGLQPDDIDWFVPHSANMRIVKAICERTGIASERTLTSMGDYGNTSAASIPLALDSAVREGLVKPGHLVLLYGFGGGLTQAGVMIRWSL
ncbi:ketoacyl-ACP synthase III [Paenibacillus harenae]|uniref:Beta-ketoacyl-[acyl-carrier-protein] synthase III n=1 Tax=Paenibacillus harenae TaxID=306543 RepID=A0ABT9U7H9_PAEHA|nr:ketoacyl-ACP synthase III [Paenibacillus harenae]MDQ0114404.1 3-oxoacyl-[acyl-carrier-protein] synthase-3 [Paenibacillus harenae]